MSQKRQPKASNSGGNSSYRQVKQKSLLTLLSDRVGKGFSQEELLMIQKVFRVDQLIDGNPASSVSAERVVVRGRDLEAERAAEVQRMRDTLGVLHARISAMEEEKTAEFQRSSAADFLSAVEALRMSEDLGPKTFKQVMGQTFSRLEQLTVQKQVELLLLHFRG